MRAVSDVTAVRVTVPSSCVTSVYVTLPRGSTVPLASANITDIHYRKCFLQ